LKLIFFDRVLSGPSNGEHFVQVRTLKVPYLTNAEENELSCLKTMTVEGILGYEELWAQKAREVPLLFFFGGERKWRDSDSNFWISTAIAHSFRSYY
jgi:hypothetical protein